MEGWTFWRQLMPNNFERELHQDLWAHLLLMHSLHLLEKQIWNVSDQHKQAVEENKNTTFGAITRAILTYLMK